MAPPFVPMPLVDDFLIQYSVGQALLLLYVLSLPAGYVFSSWRITAVNAIVFGVLFLIVPSIGGGSILFAYLGIGLVVLGPMIYATTNR